jgi:hypothetical protein
LTKPTKAFLNSIQKTHRLKFVNASAHNQAMMAMSGQQIYDAANILTESDNTDFSPLRSQLPGAIRQGRNKGKASPMRSAGGENSDSESAMFQETKSSLLRKQLAESNKANYA